MDVDTAHSSPHASGSGANAGASSSTTADHLPFTLAHEAELDDDDVPDEDLDTSSGKHQLWLVKVPAYLMNEWNRVKVPDVRLGTVRVYDELDASGKQRMELLLPPDWQSGTAPITSTTPTNHKRKASEDSKPSSSSSATTFGNLPKVFDLKLAPYDAAGANLYAFREQWEGAGAGAGGGEVGGEGGGNGEGSSQGRAGTPADLRAKKRPRVTTALIGCVANETHIQAKVDPKGGVAPEIRQQLRRRRAEAEKKRSIQMLDADEGTANMLASGVNVGLLKSRFGKFQIAKTPGTSKTLEKRARMPKNELLDMLWPLFESQTHLRLKQIAERVHQPEAYLRDVLGEVADLHKRGPYAGHYSVKGEFQSALGGGRGAGAGAGGSGSAGASASAGGEGEQGAGGGGGVGGDEAGEGGGDGDGDGGDEEFEEVA